MNQLILFPLAHQKTISLLIILGGLEVISNLLSQICFELETQFDDSSLSIIIYLRRFALVRTICTIYKT